MKENKIKIAAFQETKLKDESTLSETPNYTLVRKDQKKDAGGGLAFLIHKDIPFQKLPDPPADPHLEYLGIKVNNISLINIYIPPTSSCTAGYTPNLARYLPQEDGILLADINAHDALWFSQLSDSRGSDLADIIGDSNLGVINEDSPTRLPSNGPASSPDITLASLSLLPYASWETRTSLGSDHLPIIVTLVTDVKPIKSENRTYINFRKANWDKFEEETEAEFSKLPPPTDIYAGEKIFRKILNNTSKTTIPAGRIRNIYPEVPTDTADKMKQRDDLRESDPNSPNLAQLNIEINKEINDHRRDKWRATVENVNRKTNPAQLFKLIKHLNGGPKASSNESIKFKGKYISNSNKIANAFNKQFSSVIRHTSSKSARTITKNLKKNKLNEAQKFNPSETKEAIKKSKPSKALGPDKISTLHLKHLGTAGLNYLTDLFNISVTTSTIPAIWKCSTIIPLLKPKKPAEDSSSYRPVSLLCPAIKVLERLILPTLTEHLPVPDIQHGFRQKHSTVSALHDFNQDVADGFSQKKPPSRTVLLQIDLSKAFDMVSHQKLLKDLNQTTLPDHLKRWFNGYLHGRQSKVNFRNSTSTGRNVRTGVPQGAVTSPILFNFYLSQLPTPPAGVKLVQYADDISVYATGKNIQALSNGINSYIDRLVDFLEERELAVSPEKSTVTLFTPDTKEFKIHPNVQIKNKRVKLDQSPKLLGVTFDTMHTFSHHVTKTVAKAKTKVNMLKALAGSSWGQDKETLLITYKSICRSTLEYGAPIWSPIVSDSSWEKLQRVQNQALRVATGCTAMSEVHHLHQETKVLPLKEHATMVTKQYVAACFHSAHPGNKHLGKPPPARSRLKPTLVRHQEEVSSKFQADLTYKQTLTSLHTESVRDAIASYAPNRVLKGPPPEVNKEELTLSRPDRVKLARLRSDFCPSLNSYMSRLDNQVQNVCPLCEETPHDTNHLFGCRKNPTTLTVLDLWTNPKEAAIFINNIDNGEA